MKAVEIYIKTEERLQPPPGGSYADYDAHPCWQKHNIQRIIPPDQEKALKILKAAAEQKNITLKIYDVKTFSGKIKAFIHGIRTTPFTIIGTKRIEGIANLDALEKII
ncbi:MAG: hypothetical protein QXJ02_03010 [Candidatus Bathyarchaeia archaeon]